MRAAARKRIPLDRTAYIELAIRTLESSGIAAVTMLGLANQMGVTRGSIYHHFENREDLLQAMLDHWEQDSTLRIRDEVAGLDFPPSQALLALSRAIGRHNAASHDAAFRAWALHDPVAARVVRRVDETRLGFIRGLFEAVGFTGIDV